MAALLSRQRRRFLVGLLASVGAPVIHAAHPPVYKLQTEASLSYANYLLEAAMQAAGFRAVLEKAPQASELRSLHEAQSGRIHVALLPPTPERLALYAAGKIRMIPIPIERGLLGWRIGFIHKDHQHKTERIKSLEDLQALTFGQGVDWLDTKIYRQSNITTREIQAWRNGEFINQIRTGIIDVFPMGIDESINYYLPRFQQAHPEITLDQHLLIRYPWFRFVWVTADSSGDELYEALQTGFDVIAQNGEFESLWLKHRQPSKTSHRQDRVEIELNNPFYDQLLVPQHYQHLLLKP